MLYHIVFALIPPNASRCCRSMKRRRKHLRQTVWPRVGNAGGTVWLNDRNSGKPENRERQNENRDMAILTSYDSIFCRGIRVFGLPSVQR